MTAGMRALVTADPRTVVIDSHAFSMSVRRGSLVIKARGQERVISRHDCRRTVTGIARIIILANAGNVTVEAMRWCAALSVAVYQVDRDGTVNLSSPATVARDARLYREQVLSAIDGPKAQIGLQLVRELLTAKIAGQLEVLRTMNVDSPRLAECLTMLASARDMRSMMGAEGIAANHYWRHWEVIVSVPFKASDRKYLPAHWQTFNGRASVTRADGHANASNRNARNLVNAMLNYGYKVAETEAAYACYMVGLHPALGLSHGAVHDDSPAMALDILEALRPIVDMTVLSYLDYGQGAPMGTDGKPFKVTRDMAYELENGTCRLFRPLSTALASSVSMAVAGPALEWSSVIAKRLASTEKITIIAPVDPRIHERKPYMDLSADIHVSDLIPDEMWERVSPLLPAWKQRGVAADIRNVLAAIVAHEIYGCSWPVSVKPFGCKHQTARARLAEWQESGVWQDIKAEIIKPVTAESQTA